MQKVIIITRDNETQTTATREIQAKIKLISSDLHGSVADALIDGQWQRVHKDHSEGPYCDWKKTVVLG